MKTIGKLQRILLNEVWKDESEFTLWLQNNLDILSEVVGLTFARVEPGISHLIAENNSGQMVVIICQWNSHHHERLGQLITLLALGEAKIAIWIVAEPQSEQIKTVLWLNESTQVDFYLLKIEAVQIGNSPVAALLKLVVDPQEEIHLKQGNGVKKWSENAFFAKLEAQQGSVVAEIARQVFNWAQTNVSYVWWGEGSERGCFVPVFYYAGTKHQLFAVWTDGTVEIYFQWYQYKPPFNAEEKRLELLKRLNEVRGISFPPEVISQRPSFSLAVLQHNNSLDHFLETFNWFIREV